MNALISGAIETKIDLSKLSVKTLLVVGRRLVDTSFYSRKNVIENT